MKTSMMYPRAVLILIAVTLSGSVGTARRNEAAAHPGKFVFTPIAYLGDPAPGGSNFLDVFESNFINNRGDVLFGSNVTANEEQGIFLLPRRGDTTGEIARVGEPAPGGGVFGAGFGSPNALNDKGDVGFMFLLDPLSFPIGINAGVYRYSQRTRMLTAVMTPGVTPAPEGGVFAGATFGTSLNNEGLLAFGGIVPTDIGVHLADEPYLGLGAAVYSADTQGHISTVVGPGDPAPGGGVFDWALFAQINASGDVAFMGHLAGEECRPAGFPPQAFLMACLGSIYVKDGATGQLRSIAHAGDPAPGGGVYRQAISPRLNDHGDVVFLGDLTPPPQARRVTGVYRHSNGVTLAVARPGDPMPGGGHLVTASNLIGWQISVNNPGDVAFNAVLDTDDNRDGVPDTGLFVWSHGVLRLVARTGTQIPDIGEVAHLVMGVLVVIGSSGFVPNSGATMNDHGQVVFGATLTDGRGVLLVATPKSPGND
jgi:hypothetical protein